MRSVDCSHMAIHRSPARFEAGSSAGGCSQQRRFQCQSCGWPRAGRAHHRRLESRGAVLDQCAEHRRSHRGSAVVEAADDTRASSAAGAILQRYPRGIAPRALQSSSACHADPCVLILCRRQRLLGNASAGRARPGQRRAGALWHSPWCHRRRRCRRRSASPDPQAPAGRGRRGDGGNDRHGLGHGAVRHVADIPRRPSQRA